MVGSNYLGFSFFLPSTYTTLRHTEMIIRMFIDSISDTVDSGKWLTMYCYVYIYIVVMMRIK